MKSLMILAAATVGFGAMQAQAATGSAKAQMTVLSSLNVTKISDLQFSEAAAGAASETVDADSSETAQNASFEIAGEPNRAITVTLPADGMVIMRKGAGGSADTEVAVNAFTSNGLSNLDGSGLGVLYVGATRSDLSPTQEGGSYEADFDVEVIY